MATDRLDVRRMLLQRGWKETGDIWSLLGKGSAVVSVSGYDVFVSGVAKAGRGVATVTAPNSVPARVIVALCEAWATTEEQK